MTWFKGTTGVGVVAAFFIGLFPFVATEHLFYGTVNGKYFFLLAFVGLLTLWYAYGLYRDRYPVLYRGRWLLLCGVVALAVSYLAGLLGVFPERSFYAEALRSTGLWFLTYVGLLAFILSEVCNKQDWRLFQKAVALTAAVYGFLTLLGAQGFNLSFKFLTVNLENTGITLGSETFGGAYLLLTFIITLLGLVQSATVRERVFWATALLFQFLSPLLFNTVAFLSGPLGGITDPVSLIGYARSSSIAVAFFVLYVCGLLVVRRWGAERIRGTVTSVWALGWLVGLGLLVLLLFAPGSFVQNAYIEQSSAARVIVWETGLDAFLERPLLGWGSENFRFAFDSHFDNRLYLDENLGEIWFDRAHNFFVDTLVSVGVLGMLVYTILIILLSTVALRAARKGVISELEGYILAALPVAHILQLQTGFDTVATYGLLAFIGGYYLWLERRLVEPAVSLALLLRKVFGAVLAVSIVILSSIALFAEYSQQKALYKIFVTPNAGQQEECIKKALAQDSDFEAFRLASASLVNAFFDRTQDGYNYSQAELSAISRQLALYSTFMQGYVERHPEDYRTRMNVANILFLETILGKDKLAEAKVIINGSYVLSPQNPLTHVMASLAELYSGNMKGAREEIAKAVALNPEIEYTKEIQRRIERQIDNFPTVSVVHLDNL